MNIFIISAVVSTALLLNLILVCIMVIKQRKKPEFILTWTFVMLFLPIVGFVLYLFFGLGLNSKLKLQLKKKKKFALDKQYQLAKSEKSDCELVKYIKNLGGSKPYKSNTIIFNHSVDKIRALKRDIRNAKQSINMEYYIFQNDKIGREIMFLLCKKARSGVEVNLIYDAVGSKQTPKRFFRKLKKAGGQVRCFFPPFLNISFLNPRYNYRNHRKIVVIDGKVAYFGGMNIGLDIVNKKKLRPWKDIHYRIEGQAVDYFQSVFLADFLFLKGKIKDKSFYYDSAKISSGHTSNMQVICNGPEERLEKAKDIIIKLISLAKSKIVIQTPYFIPDNCLLLALKQASLSGKEVVVMMPKKQDRKILQTVGFYYAAQLIDMNVKFYLYDGFLHSKLIIIDDAYAFGGSSNYDNRSFSLNFEVNAIFYDRKTILALQKIVNQDLKNSSLLSHVVLQKEKSFKWSVSILAEILSPFL